MADKGILLIISGFSGTGKGTVISNLLSEHKDDYALSVSATTRNPREGEQDGIDYFFKTREEFEIMIDNDELIEHACYVENYYGTPRKYVEKMLSQGKNVILEIEIQGALDVKKQFPECVLIFLLPPSISELERRLRDRGTEDDSIIDQRLTQASLEVKSAYKYDYIVINDELDNCTEAIHRIVKAEKYNCIRRIKLIENIEKELQVFNA